jgi:hypothetical protein
MFQRANVGYKLGEQKVSNLLYVDDLKVFARNAKEMERCREMLQRFSTDICMDFALDKCAVVHLNKGKIVNSPVVKDIPLLTEEDSYKYLGILECDTVLYKEVKVVVEKAYMARVRSILRAGLTAKNTVQSIGAFAMPVLRYGFGVLKWTQTELRSLDRKTRKALSKAKFHSPKADIHRLYMSRQEGGRGLIGAFDCHRQECTAMAKYLEKATDPLVVLVRDAEGRRTGGLMSYARVYAKGGDTTTIGKEHKAGLLGRAIHGQFFTAQEQIEGVDLKMSHLWLQRAHLRFETEALVCAAQEQALPTNWMKAKIWKMGGSSLCRMCKEHDETIMHVVSGCKMLCGTKYTRRHDNVGKYIHWTILKDMGVRVKDSWLHHVPVPSVTKGTTTVTWDLAIDNCEGIEANRPDIVVWDLEKRTAQIIDMTIPMDKNVIAKYADKLIKYRALQISMQKSLGLRKVRVIPIVVGALGTVCDGLVANLATISTALDVSIVQKTALLGTAHILRTVLT